MATTFGNKSTATLSAGINNSVTAISLNAALPEPSSGTCNAVLTDTAGHVEFVAITAGLGTTSLTVTRASESSSRFPARAWNSGDMLTHIVSAADLNGFGTGGGGFANPMTSAGDWIIGSPGGGADTGTDYLHPATGVSSIDDQGTTTGTNGPDKVYDNNTSTFWVATGGHTANAGLSWIKFDLSTAQQIGGYKILGYNGTTSNYGTPIRISWSNDNSSFTDVGDVDFADNVVKNMPGAPTARYWKFQCLSGDASNAWAIKELYLYGQSGSAPGDATRLPAGQNLTDAATVNWDVTAGYNAQVILAGNRTMAAPTNLVAGQVLVLSVVQDGTGSRTLTWNGVFKWASGTAPTLSTGVNKRDVFAFVTNGTNLFAFAQAIDVR